MIGKRLTKGEFSRGHWFDPTVLKVNDNAMQIMQDEVFGPVVPVMTVSVPICVKSTLEK